MDEEGDCGVAGTLQNRRKSQSRVNLPRSTPTTETWNVGGGCRRRYRGDGGGDDGSDGSDGG